MTLKFHPVYDNPVRMGYVPGWTRISDLTDRLTDLEQAFGDATVAPAPWEPYYEVCRCGRYAAAYRWAQSQLQAPASFAVALALFPGEEEQLATRIGHANWLLLATKGEESQVTRKLMLVEALELWEAHATEWLERIVRTCGDLGVTTAVASLHQQVQAALLPLGTALAHEEARCTLPGAQSAGQESHGFDRELLRMDGWTPDPGLVILPVDGKTLSLAREILRLDLQKIVLLKAGRAVRTVPWDKVSHVYLFEGTVTFGILDEAPLAVAGYKRPEDVLAIIQGCDKAATERLLQTVASKVTRITP